MSSRSAGGGGSFRRVSVSRDGGQSWSQFRLAKDLVTPPCMSGVIRHAWPEGNQPGMLLHSLPNTKGSRQNGTLFISRDEGNSWQKGRVIQPGRFGYSCLAKLADGDIGCLFEGEDGQMVFARVTLDWLRGG